MKVPFDAIYINNKLVIVHIICAIRPFRFSPIIRKAQMVLELPVGTVLRSGTDINDQLYLYSEHHALPLINITRERMRES